MGAREQILRTRILVSNASACANGLSDNWVLRPDDFCDMHAKLNSRLQELEVLAQRRRTNAANAVVRAALGALSDAAQGATLDASLANCSLWGIRGKMNAIPG